MVQEKEKLWFDVNRLSYLYVELFRSVGAGDVPRKLLKFPGRVGSGIYFITFFDTVLNRFWGMMFPGKASRVNPPAPSGRVVAGSKIRTSLPCASLKELK